MKHFAVAACPPVSAGPPPGGAPTLIQNDDHAWASLSTGVRKNATLAFTPSAGNTMVAIWLANSDGLVLDDITMGGQTATKIGELDRAGQNAYVSAWIAQGVSATNSISALQSTGTTKAGNYCMYWEFDSAIVDPGATGLFNEGGATDTGTLAVPPGHTNAASYGIGGVSSNAGLLTMDDPGWTTFNALDNDMWAWQEFASGMSNEDGPFSIVGFRHWAACLIPLISP